MQTLILNIQYHQSTLSMVIIKPWQRLRIQYIMWMRTRRAPSPLILCSDSAALAPNRQRIPIVIQQGNNIKTIIVPQNTATLYSTNIIFSDCISNNVCFYFIIFNFNFNFESITALGPSSPPPPPPPRAQAVRQPLPVTGIILSS